MEMVPAGVKAYRTFALFVALAVASVVVVVNAAADPDPLEHAALGIYVEGMTTLPVQSYTPPKPKPVKASGTSKPKTVVVRPASTSSASGIRGIGQRMAAERGWTGAQWTALDNLWSRESGWSTTATNPSSGACGIMQKHPCNGYSSLSATEQIRIGLDYIKGRYGSPLAAWGFFLARNWY